MSALDLSIGAKKIKVVFGRKPVIFSGRLIHLTAWFSFRRSVFVDEFRPVSRE
jgi:hypothetical protein